MRLVSVVACPVVVVVSSTTISSKPFARRATVLSARRMNAESVASLPLFSVISFLTQSAWRPYPSHQERPRQPQLAVPGPGFRPSSQRGARAPTAERVCRSLASILSTQSLRSSMLALAATSRRQASPSCKLSSSACSLLTWSWRERIRGTRHLPELASNRGGFTLLVADSCCRLRSLSCSASFPLGQVLVIIVLKVLAGWIHSTLPSTLGHARIFG
ncbi:hypothetical protein HDK64DRAFT_76878 [Phyllosticta capitalensis]